MISLDGIAVVLAMILLFAYIISALNENNED
jgi:hypothetical protein